jgi:hypothetical protein
LPPIIYAVAQVFRDRGSKRVAVQEDDTIPGSAQPAPQFSTHGGLAGAG